MSDHSPNDKSWASRYCDKTEKNIDNVNNVIIVNTVILLCTVTPLSRKGEAETILSHLLQSLSLYMLVIATIILGV